MVSPETAQTTCRYCGSYVEQGGVCSYCGSSQLTKAILVLIKNLAETNITS